MTLWRGREKKNHFAEEKIGLRLGLGRVLWATGEAEWLGQARGWLG